MNQLKSLRTRQNHMRKANNKMNKKMNKKNKLRCKFVLKFPHTPPNLASPLDLYSCEYPGGGVLSSYIVLTKIPNTNLFDIKLKLHNANRKYGPKTLY